MQCLLRVIYRASYNYLHKINKKVESLYNFLYKNITHPNNIVLNNYYNPISMKLFLIYGSVIQ